jgi:hypothetical protein
VGGTSKPVILLGHPNGEEDGFVIDEPIHILLAIVLSA